MGLQNVTSSERLHIAFFGMRNAGKSNLVNAVTGQQLSIVSDIKGTTTDPVKKAMELLPLGPVVVIDTPGLDDEGALGHLRVEKAKQILALTDIALLIVDATIGLCSADHELMKVLQDKNIPFLIVYNKVDLLSNHPTAKDNILYVSAVTGEGIHELKERIGSYGNKIKNSKRIVADLICPGDIVILVTPIDEAAPKGRLILPQQLTIRDILDAHGIVITCQDNELKSVLQNLSVKPKLVITDSQAFERVNKDTPEDILLTSFSILMARYKGDLKELVQGATALSKLRDNDKVLICEGCTHHRQCNDIGTVKMPHWIESFTKAKLEFAFTSGGEFPEDLSPYSVIVHCGSCMLNEAEMKHRIKKATAANVPIVNYGIGIAHMHDILKRSIQPFPNIFEMLD